MVCTGPFSNSRWGCLGVREYTKTCYYVRNPLGPILDYLYTLSETVELYAAPIFLPSSPITLYQVRAKGMANKPLDFDLTPEELAAGRRKPKTSSKYTGVCWLKGRSKWRAKGKINGKAVYLGSHNTEVAAAKKYDAWAHPLGKTVNFPEDYAGEKALMLASRPPPKKTPVECMQRDATRFWRKAKLLRVGVCRGEVIGSAK